MYNYIFSNLIIFYNLELARTCAVDVLCGCGEWQYHQRMQLERKNKFIVVLTEVRVNDCKFRLFKESSKTSKN
jgi:hypothetical protein